MPFEPSPVFAILFVGEGGCAFGDIVTDAFAVVTVPGVGSRALLIEAHANSISKVPEVSPFAFTWNLSPLACVDIKPVSSGGSSFPF